MAPGFSNVEGLELVKQGVTTPEELLRIAYYA